MVWNLVRIFILFILLNSCSSNDSTQKEVADSIFQKSQIVDSSTQPTNEGLLVKNKDARKFGDSITKISTSFSFVNAVFDLGNSIHFDDCSFYFECDCCAGILILDKDSVFYNVSYCMEDLTVTRGVFSVHKNNIYFISDGIRVDKQLDPSKDYNPNNEEYTLTESFTEPYEMTFEIKSCDGNPLLVDYGNENTFIASFNHLKVKDELMQLEKEGILSKFSLLKLH